MRNFTACKKELNDFFINYHCKHCGEIPLLFFDNYYFDIICSTHKILNINYNTFFNYIIYEYDCCICQNHLNETLQNFFYCYECDKNYCNICVNQHKNNTHFIININEKNTICKLHHQKFNRFCFKCKLNLCDLCTNHNNHYIEYFKDIYPLNEDITRFRKSINKIIQDNKKGIKKFLEIYKIQTLLLDSFSNNKSNYYYINNINNMIRRTFTKDDNEKINEDKNEEDNNNPKDDKCVKYPKLNGDINNIENKILIKSLDKNITEDFYSEIWCMKKLNDIKISQNKKIELIAIGSSNHKILLLNTLNFKVYQIIDEHERSVYSLEQYKDDPTYLYSSSNDKNVNIYKLNNNYKYDLIQKLKKSEEKTGGEINKVIILYNKLLVTGDYRSITIWEQNHSNNNKVYYEEIHEVIINRETCQLLEVNPSVFVATQFYVERFQVYKNDGKAFPLLGELLKVKSHGNSSNGLAKINDKIVCSVSKKVFYIICIEPIEVIQIINIPWNELAIYYIYVTKENYIYIKGEYQNIVQYKIIIDEDSNFLELDEIGQYLCEKKHSYEKAILPFYDGRIFFMEEKNGQKFYQMIA